MALNKKRVKLLIHALKTTRRKQGRGRLCKDNTYCCLGIACEVAIANGCKVEKDRVGKQVSYDGETAYLPQSVKNWYGFNTNEPDLLIDGHVEGATVFNDQKPFRYSFRKIAVGFENLLKNE